MIVSIQYYYCIPHDNAQRNAMLRSPFCSDQSFEAAMPADATQSLQTRRQGSYAMLHSNRRRRTNTIGRTARNHSGSRAVVIRGRQRGIWRLEIGFWESNPECGMVSTPHHPKTLCKPQIPRILNETVALTMPEARAVSICSLLAFAVTAMIGTCLTMPPDLSNLRISRAHVKPSMTGISRSIRITPRSTASEL